MPCCRWNHRRCFFGSGSGQVFVLQALQPEHFEQKNGTHRSKTVTWKNAKESNSLNQKPEKPASKLEAIAIPEVMPKTL